METVACVLCGPTGGKARVIPSTGLHEARQILKPRGRVMLYLPNAGSAEAALFGDWWVAWDPPRHLFHFDYSESSRPRVFGNQDLRLVKRQGVRSGLWCIAPVGMSRQCGAAWPSGSAKSSV